MRQSEQPGWLVPALVSVAGSEKLEAPIVLNRLARFP
jgi:hypothetical protein